MSLREVFETLRLVGRETGRADVAERFVTDLQARVAAVSDRTETIPTEARPRVAFLEWIDPPFCGGHWNPALVEMAGGVDVLGRSGQPSRTISWESIVASPPDVLFLACCGFRAERTRQDVPILERKPGWGDLPCVQTGRVYVSDGNAYFSRPGPRLVDSIEILAHALHPDIHPLPVGLPAAERMI